jgi:hypothetical protein
MKESLQKVISGMVDANETSKMLMAYNHFMASKQEDEKMKATYNMRADSFDETIKEKEKEIESLQEFLVSLEGIPYTTE